MSLAAWTYDSLQQAIQDHLEEDGDELVAALPTIIGLAELRLLRDLDLEIFDVTDTSVAMTAGGLTITKPAGLVALRSMWFTPVGGGAWTPLDQKTVEYIRQYAPNPTTQGPPKFFAELTDATWLIGPTPDAAYPVVIRMMKRPDGLQTDTAGTYLSQTYPDGLLYACLYEAELFLGADERSAVWLDPYERRVLPPALYEQRRKRRRDYKPMTAGPGAVEKVSA